MSQQMSFKDLMKVLGLGAVAFVLGVEWLNWLTRHLRDSHGPLKEVLFFPSPQVCVEHLFTRRKRFPCACPLPHGVETSFSRLLGHLLSARMSLDLCVFSTSFSRLLGHLLSARMSLDLCVFSFSHMELSRAILLLHKQGVVVRVVTDRDYMTITGSQIGTVRKAGIRVRHEMSAAVHMHHKFALVDGRKLITGSLNWTLTAVQSNKENVMVTEELELVRPYQQEFQKLWEASDPANHKPQCTNGQLH
uniref:Mitochondrial cardiolipin hydrolase n=1 Tax=Sinocyclocheilus anshuiensis TaxID=1608454 RepID=A0A671L8Z4_9TELE